MAIACGVTIVKKFNYRGNAEEEWSNKYWLSGVPPDGDAAWKALADVMIVNEKQCYSPGSAVVRAYGYDDNATDANSVWQYDYELAGQAVQGTLPTGGGILMAGDQAGTTWWKTSRKTSRGKWIYLRKYFHDGYVGPSDTDALNAGTVAAYDAWNAVLLTDAAMGRHLQSQTGPEDLQLGDTSPWVTTRTLKRRGRRP